MRALIVVTHLLGAGHLTRAAAIGRALAARGHAVTLVSGGTSTSLVDLSGLAVAQLPPVRAFVGDFTTLRDETGQPAGDDLLRARRDSVLAAYAEADPDVILTELYPFGRRGLAGEFVALIEAAEARPVRPLLVSSIRDVLATPTKHHKIAEAEDLAARHYDAVLVHGDPSVIPLEASWPVGDRLRRLLVYTGYVESNLRPPISAVPPSGGAILVSGGSSAAGLPLYRTALEAARLDPSKRWHILVGIAVFERDFRELREAAPSNATVERARPDFRTLMAESAVFVGQAGYNTVMDIVATQPRTVLVPFEKGLETEQRLRAGCLAERGLASILLEETLDASSLAAAVEAALRRPRPSFPVMRLDGAAETARHLEALVERRAPAAVTP